jgi:hypothetical protein
MKPSGNLVMTTIENVQTQKHSIDKKRVVIEQSCWTKYGRGEEDENLSLSSFCISLKYSVSVVLKLEFTGKLDT